MYSVHRNDQIADASLQESTKNERLMSYINKSIDKKKTMSKNYRNKIAGFVYTMAHDPCQVTDQYIDKAPSPLRSHKIQPEFKSGAQHQSIQPLRDSEFVDNVPSPLVSRFQFRQRNKELEIQKTFKTTCPLNNTFDIHSGFRTSGTSRSKIQIRDKSPNINLHRDQGSQLSLRGADGNSSAMENRSSSAAKMQKKMRKAIRLGERRASSQMNNAAKLSPRGGEIERIRRNVADIKTHFKGARSLLLQAENSTRIEKGVRKGFNGEIIRKTEDESAIEGVMGIIQNQLMSEHGEGTNPEKKHKVSRFRKFIGPETDIILTPETLTHHVLNYTGASRRRADNVPVLKKGAGFFRTITANPGLADAASRTVFGNKILKQNSNQLGALLNDNSQFFHDAALGLGQFTPRNGGKSPMGRGSKVNFTMPPRGRPQGVQLNPLLRNSGSAEKAMNLSSSIALGLEDMTPLSSSIVINRGPEMTERRAGPPYLPGRKPAHLLSPLPNHTSRRQGSEVGHEMISGFQTINTALLDQSLSPSFNTRNNKVRQQHR